MAPSPYRSEFHPLHNLQSSSETDPHHRRVVVSAWASNYLELTLAHFIPASRNRSCRLTFGESHRLVNRRANFATIFCVVIDSHLFVFYAPEYTLQMPLPIANVIF